MAADSVGTAEIDILRKRCWKNALEAFGTGFIFEQRARRLRRLLRWLTFLGIAVPVTVGGVVLSFGTKPELLPYVIAAAGVLGVAQLIGSVWSLTATWQDSLSYARESVSANYRLSKEFADLAEAPPTRLEEFRWRLGIIEKEDEQRQALDYQQDILEVEKRAGMCAALRRFERTCAGCGKIPRSLIATDCEVCGKF